MVILDRRLSLNIIIATVVVIGVVLNLRAEDFSHSEFDYLLKNHTKSGLVSYREIKESDSILINYLEKLNNVSEYEYSAWDKSTKIAFWINAYNAITIYGIISNYPIEYGGLLTRVRFPKNSIRQIKDFWDTDFSDVNGRKITLNQIEHEILRKEIGDPRIHFSIVCASIGCPELFDDVYQGDSLDWQLDNDARRFINNPEKVRLDTKKNIIYISSIFKWYAVDFPQGKNHEQLKRYKKKERGIINFITEYMTKDQKDYITQQFPKIKYLDYDWSLNELKE